MLLNQLLPSIRATVVLALYTGIVFPVAITLVAQTVFPWRANGSLVNGADHSTVIGSQLLAQGFSQPRYFHERPSAAGSGYAGEASGGTNYGPTSKKLIMGDKDFSGIKQLVEAYRKENNLPDNVLVPVDAVTRSASGLDPDISSANALLQAPRVAKARNITESAVTDMIHRYTKDRDLGFLGEPHVNVLELNLALDGRPAG